MSGEATKGASVGTDALERAFGPRARCNACGTEVEDYRVVALFLHDTAAVRAYCRTCYGAAADGDHFARGDGLVLGYTEFAQRFGAPGPVPPPASAVDRRLVALVRERALRALAPASEAVAKRRRLAPYRFRVTLELAGAAREAQLCLANDGSVTSLDGDPDACARVRVLLGPS